MTAHNVEPSSPADDGRKRVAKACDRCRLKKIKCDGKVPCSRCQSENTVCRFGERKKSVERRIPPGYVEYLEEQQKILVKALKKTWQEYATPSPHLAGVADPPIHSIMEDLGVLSDFASHRRGKDGFRFEEDLEKIRLQCEEAESSETARHSSRASSSVPEMTDSEDHPGLTDSWSTASERSATAGASTPNRNVRPTTQMPRSAATWPVQTVMQNAPNGDLAGYNGLNSSDMDWSSAQNMDMDCDPFDTTFQTISPTLLDMPSSMNTWEAPSEAMSDYNMMLKNDDSLPPNMVMVG